MEIDLHNHSSESSQCSHIDARLLVERYAGRPDIDGFCLTDHLSKSNLELLAKDGTRQWSEIVSRLVLGYRIASSKESRTRVFFGVEYGIERNDFLLYGLDPEELTDMEYLLQFDISCLARLRAQRPHVAVIQAHPFRRRCHPVDLALLDGIEIYNGMFFHDEENAKALAFAQEHRLVGVGGTDCHEDDVGRMMTRFDARVSTNRGLAEAIRGERVTGFHIKDIARDLVIPYAVRPEPVLGVSGAGGSGHVATKV